MTPFLLHFLQVMRRDKPRIASSDHYRKHASSGFSLLEMIAIVVIIGILAALAAPGWVGFTSRQRLNTTSNEILQAIRSTQTTAKQRRSSQIKLWFQDNDDEVPQLSKTFAGNDDFDDGIVTTLGDGNLEGDMVKIAVTDSTGAAVETLQFAQDGSIDPSVEFPVKIVLSSDSTSAKRCLLVETLLGSVRSLSDSDNGCP